MQTRTEVLLTVRKIAMSSITKCEDLPDGTQKCWQVMPPTTFYEAPHARLEISWTELLEVQDTGRMEFSVVRDDVAAPYPQEVTVEYSSPAIRFSPPVLEALHLGDKQTFRRVLFKSDTTGVRRVLIRAWAGDNSGASSGKASVSENMILIQVLEPRFFLGMSERTLRGIQFLSGAVGIPALSLFLLNLWLRRRRTVRKTRVIRPSESEIGAYAGPHREMTPDEETRRTPSRRRR